MLDANDDGQLSADELNRCAETLARFDDDDDGSVTSEEFETLREQLRVDAGRISFAERTGNPFAALYLEPDFAKDRIEYLLTDLYAPQQNLHPENFPLLASQYRKVDTNSDGRLDQDELAGISTTEPHLKLAVNFTSKGSNGANQAMLTVNEHIPEVSVASQSAANRAVLTLGTTRLVILAEDLVRGPQPVEKTAASEVRLMVHDQCDALGELLDADADGRLGEREISTSANAIEI